MPNGAFEILDTCPNADGQIYRAKEWISSGGTPSYFNACVTTPYQLGVPSNYVGYQNDCCGGVWHMEEFIRCAVRLTQVMIVAESALG